jgi:predicted acyltransferase
MKSSLPSSNLDGGQRARIASMDQFRGFTVLSMFAVHFARCFQQTVDSSAVLGHNNTYLSFADTVLPSFLFAAGFSLRLTLLRRLAGGARATYLPAIRRCLLLILLLQVLQLDRWGPRFLDVLHSHGFWAAINVLLKGRMLESLSIIGITSLWVLPVIAASVRARAAFILSGLVAHVIICHAFYFDYLYGRPNWLDDYLGTVGETGYEGGILGVLTWAVPMLAGSLAYDLLVARVPRAAARTLLVWSAGLLFVAYSFSCLSNLYPLAHPSSSKEFELIENGQIARSPIIPDGDSLSGLDHHSFLAQPPLVRPSAESQRQLNYWIMAKRVVTPTFVVAATGFAMGVYALFVLLSDVLSIDVGVLRTFGQNPLAAYVIELYLIGGMLLGSRWPTDSTLLWGLAHFSIWFGLTYLAVRFLEKRHIYIRL